MNKRFKILQNLGYGEQNSWFSRFERGWNYFLTKTLQFSYDLDSFSEKNMNVRNVTLTKKPRNVENINSLMIIITWEKFVMRIEARKLDEIFWVPAKNHFLMSCTNRHIFKLFWAVLTKNVNIIFKLLKQAMYFREVFLLV